MACLSIPVGRSDRQGPACVIMCNNRHDALRSRERRGKRQQQGLHQDMTQKTQWERGGAQMMEVAASSMPFIYILI